MKNKAMAIEAIMNDCESRYVYFDDEGKTCAIGGLIKAAVPDFDFVSLRDKEENSQNIAFLYGHFNGREGPEDTSVLREILVEHYGLSPYEMALIQGTNDREWDADARRKAVAAVIESFEED